MMRWKRRVHEWAATGRGRCTLARAWRCMSHGRGLVGIVGLLWMSLCGSASGQEASAAVKFAPYQARMQAFLLEDAQRKDGVQQVSDERLLSAINRAVALNLPVDDRETDLRYAKIGNGVFEDYDLRVIRLAGLQGLWRNTPKPQAGLADYMVDRELDAGFQDRLHAVLAADPVLSPWDEPLGRQAELTRTAVRDGEAVRMDDFTPEERADLLRRNDLPGKLNKLKDLVAGMFGVLAGGASEDIQAWKALQDFLKADIDEQLESAVKDRHSNRGVMNDLEDVFWSALGVAPGKVQARYAPLKSLKRRLYDQYFEAEKWALTPYQTPTGTLNGISMRQYLEALNEYEEDIVDACNTPEMDEHWLRALDGMFDIQGALIDRVDVRAGGRYLLQIRTLERIGATYVSGDEYAKEDLVYDEPVAMNTVHRLDRYQDELLRDSKSNATLWGAMEIDPNLREIAGRVGGWVLWNWIDEPENSGLESANRLVNFPDGSRWLLPEGETGGSVRTGQDLLTTHARLVVVALDSSTRMDAVLEDRWTEYLKAIQGENDYPNWSRPPYDLYVERQTQR